MEYSIRSAIGMMVLFVVAVSPTWAAPPTAGCNSNSWSSGTCTMPYEGIDRIFRVHVPKGYKKTVAAPLALVFHGWGGDENEFLGSKTVTSLADKRGYILVAPRGLGSGEPDNSPNSWTFSGSDTGLDGVSPPNRGKICDDRVTPDYSYPSCEKGGTAQNTCSWTQCQSDDVGFAVALVAHVKAHLNVDEARVFATGGSNGGMFTWELGQNPRSAGVFRAIAPLIGLPHRGYLDAPGKLDEGDLPVLVITGTRDNVVPPGDWEDDSFTTTSNGSDRFFYTGATGITQVWAVAHGCSIESPATSFNDGNRKTDCRTYCSGAAGWPKVLDCRVRMGHTYGLSWAWPLILDFFDAHSN